MMRLDFRNPPPREPRGLDPEARRLIDEAVAAGRVKVIPRGVSAFTPAMWDGDKNRLVGLDPRTEKQKAADKRRATNAARSRYGLGPVK